MSPLETIRSLGRPLAYYPALAKHVGGINAAIFLGQLMYWDERAEDGAIGVYKSSEQWQTETGLSYKEQMNARKKLRTLGLLSETHKRLQHRIYYKLNHDAFDDFINQILSENAQENGESPEGNLPNDPKGISPNDQRAFREQPKGHLGANPKSSSGTAQRANRYIDRDYIHRLQAETTSKESPSPADCPVEEIVELYHRFMPENPPVKIVDEDRREKITARWHEAATLDLAPFHRYQNREAGLLAWKEFFDICAHSDFLTGKVAPGPGRERPFLADLDFLMSARGFKGCIENKYHRGNS